MPDYLLPDGRIPVLVSSDTADLVAAEAVALLRYVEDHPGVSPGALASMLMRVRVPRRHRALALVRDRAELIGTLNAIADGTPHDSVVRPGVATARKIGYVFPGQGSQRPGMGKLYYDSSPAYRAEIDRCEEIFQRLYQWSPLDYVLNPDGPADVNVRVVQPALFMQMVGLAAMWRAAGVAPAAVIGHSQGEIAAAYVSGAMTLNDAIHIVTSRATLVDEVSPRGHTMAVVAVDRAECEALLARNSGWVELSVINSPHILCVSGERPTVLGIVEKLNAEGKFAREIRVEYPAHTSIVAQFQHRFRGVIEGYLDNAKFLHADVPCIGATLGGQLFPDLPTDEYWYWNLRNTVRFDLAIAEAAEQGIDTYVEIAENPTLMLAIGENLSVSAPDRANRVIGTSRRTAEDLGEFTRNLATVATLDATFDWDALRIDTPTIELPLRDFPPVQMNAVTLWARYATPEGPPGAEYPQRLAVGWTRLQRRTLVPPRRLLLVDHTGQCAEFAAALVTAADDHGGSAAIYDGSGQTADAVVILLPEHADLDARAALGEFADFFGRREWWTGIDSGATELWLVTVGGEAVTDDDPAPNLFHGAVTAGYRAIATEHPTIAFRHLDLAPGQAKAATVVAALHTAKEPDLALRAGKVYAKRLVVDDATDGLDIDLDHVVIVGGTGKLGLEFTEHCARSGARRVTLLSRSGETAAVAPRLARIRGLGATEIDVAACDVGDESAVLQLASGLADDPASLVVHAAVNYVDSDFSSITPEMVLEAGRSKVLGIANVLRSIPMSDDCRVLLCSSIAATIGGRGQLLYALTNRMLDVLACHLREQGIDCVSVEWGLWSVQGPLDDAGVAKVEGTGVIPMDPADAIDVGITRGLRDGIVVAADWGEAEAVLSVFGYGPVLSGLAPAVAAPVQTAPAAPIVAEVPATPAAPRTGTLTEQMVRELNLAMGLADGDSLDGSVPLVALGLDSLQALDFRKRVKAELGRDLPIAAILGGASLDDVVRLMTTEGSIHV